MKAVCVGTGAEGAVPDERIESIFSLGEVWDDLSSACGVDWVRIETCSVECHQSVPGWKYW